MSSPGRRGPSAVRVRGCAGCGACLRSCPQQALRPTGDLREPLHALPSRCNGCGECVEVCPVDAIEVLAGA